MTLRELRDEIDRVDREIVRLLNQRAHLARQIGRIKRELGEDEPVYRPEREAQVYAQVESWSEGELPPEALRAIYREILSASRAVQRPLRVGYLGPVATFTYEAARRHFGSSAILVPCRTIGDVFAETQRQTVDFGVVPVENSTEGAVTHTLDGFLEFDVKICAEIELPVSHNLLARGRLEDITRVYSHPQALAQCRQWLSERLPHAVQIETASTAQAAEMITDTTSAAIATEAASDLYGIPIIARRIEDVSTNVTRFLVIGPRMSEPSGHDRTAIVFAVQNRTGALHEALRWLAENDVNLTRIESRPTRRRLWEYVFFVDLDGHPNDPNVARALEGLGRSCSFLRVLGAWPVTNPAVRV